MNYNLDWFNNLEFRCNMYGYNTENVLSYYKLRICVLVSIQLTGRGI